MLEEVEGLNPDGESATVKTSPLLLAAKKGHAGVIEVLAEAGGDFTATSELSQETILHSILKNGKRNEPGYQE